MLLSESNVVIIVPIEDLDRAIKFYTETLGGELTMRAEGDMNDMWASLNIGKTEFWLTKPEKHEKRELAYNAHVVKNIRETVSGLQRKGVIFEPAELMRPDTKIEGPISVTPYGAAAFFKDSEGNLLMVFENPSE
jgi:predicted enzyme related to lactoylglutathione lyase